MQPLEIVELIDMLIDPVHHLFNGQIISQHSHPRIGSIYRRPSPDLTFPANDLEMVTTLMITLEHQKRNQHQYNCRTGTRWDWIWSGGWSRAVASWCSRRRIGRSMGLGICRGWCERLGGRCAFCCCYGYGYDRRNSVNLISSDITNL